MNRVEYTLTWREAREECHRCLNRYDDIGLDVYELHVAAMPDGDERAVWRSVYDRAIFDREVVDENQQKMLRVSCMSARIIRRCISHGNVVDAKNWAQITQRELFRNPKTSKTLRAFITRALALQPGELV